MKNNILLIPMSLFFVKVMAQPLCNSPITPKAKDLYSNLSKQPVIATRPNLYFSNCNVNDSVKKILLYRVRNWKWTKDEINDYAKRKIDERRDYLIESQANIIANNDTIAFKRSKDSLEKFWQLYWRNEAVSKFQHVDANLVLTLGRLNMKESMPYLKDTALLDSIHYDKWAIELTLAKMGSNFFYNKIMLEEKMISPIKTTDLFKQFQKSFKTMAFLGTQESAYQLNKWINPTFLFQTNSHGTMGRMSTEFIQQMKLLILNKEFIELVDKVDIDEISNEKALMAVKNWMIKNKGKYLINTVFCPY